MPAPSNDRYAVYPDAQDVELLLKSSAIWPTNATKQQMARVQAQIGAASAADEWEKRGAQRPFLASYAKTNPQTRPFQSIDLDGTVPFRSAAQSIVSVTQGGRSYQSSEYELLDGEQLAFEPPYTGLRFIQSCGLHYHDPSRNRVQVTAVWGWCETVPPYVWQQILQAAALIALTSVENLPNIASLSEDGFNKAFDVVGVITQKDLLVTWLKDYLNAVQQYRRDVEF